MALFDSVISGASEKLGLGDKSSTMLSAILALVTNKDTGGFSGFIDKLKGAGLGDEVESWVSTGENKEVSGEQIEAALGSDTVSSFADEVGVSKEKATSALAYMTPKVVDNLTPDGKVPDNDSILSKVGGLLTGVGGAAAGVVAGAAGAAGSVASGAADKAGDAVNAGKDAVGAAADKVGDTASAAADKVGDTANAAKDKVTGAFSGDDDDDGSVLKWLLPLLLLGILLILGYMFLNKDKGTTPTDPSSKTTTESHSTSDSDKASGADDADKDKDSASNEDRKLGTVALPNGVNLDAYPGGIEEQLIEFIKSDEYKNATNEDLKKHWFDFDDLKFKFGKTELEDSSQRQLDNIVAILKAYPDVKMKIGGYTDKKGDDAANKALSDKRAKVVQSALAKAGVGDQVPEAEGYGEEQAKVAEDASDEERAADRKTSVRLLKSDGEKPAEKADEKPADDKATDDTDKKE